jgi:Putative Zn-dependent protease
VLENSTQAVLGIKEGGAEALRLDSVAVPEAQTLEDYVHSGWIDGLVESSVAKIEINSMPAITASARSGEWNFRLAVIRFADDEVYRMIFATHGLDDAHERPIANRSIRSARSGRTRRRR